VLTLSVNVKFAEKLLLDQEMKFYHFVSQAELTIDGIDDNEEMTMTDVRRKN
jgi:hypothetical protein